MVRAAAVAAVIFGLMAQGAVAGQATASFSVGITIGGPVKASKLVKHRSPGAATIVPAAPMRSYTWGAAAISVSRAGFAPATRAEKSGNVYWFIARRGPALYRVAVSVTSGAVLKVIPA